MNKETTRIMKWCLVALCCCFFFSINGQRMNQHQWQNRILVIKAGDATNAKYQEQLLEFADSADELKERKFVLYNVLDNSYATTDYQEPQRNQSWREIGSIDAVIGSKTEGFEVILIGLDGDVKLRQTEVLRALELYRIIDSMPMRVQELRHREQRKN